MVEGLKRRGVCVGLVLAGWAASGSADEMLVFHKGGAFQGRAMRVRSYTEKAGQLILTGADGNVLSVAKDSIDWELTRKATADMQRKDEAEASRIHTEKEAKRAAAAASATRRSRHVGIVEAARRYGVDRPGMSVANGTAAQAAPARPTEPSAAPPSPGEANAARDRVKGAKTERENIAKQIQDLEKDTNPDPQSAMKRNSRLEEKRKQLADADKLVAEAEAEAKKSEEKGAAKPSPTPGAK